ncbi:DUF3499 family protein [Corynebacterium suedekumii]|nr:DUF3499 family protein [Corynebacterium suedekumii]
MTYAYAESTAVVGPLALAAEPHSWDLCEHHAEKITAPLGWEMLRVNHIDIDDDDDLTALAEAVREAGRVTSGLVDADGPAPVRLEAKDPADPDTSIHPVYRTKRVSEEKAAAAPTCASFLRTRPTTTENPLRRTPGGGRGGNMTPHAYP